MVYLLLKKCSDSIIYGYKNLQPNVIPAFKTANCWDQQLCDHKAVLRPANDSITYIGLPITREFFERIYSRAAQLHTDYSYILVNSCYLLLTVSNVACISFTILAE